MKHLDEYRDPERVKYYIEEIRKVTKNHWNIMEVCGGQTHSLVKNGILNILPAEITLIHGPGCPVCVTPLNLIDQAVYLAEERRVTLCSFGDMLRVPGSKRSLLESKAKGADIRILYSPLEAVQFARRHPELEVVFFAVGFETTAPANALSVIQAEKLGLTNYSILPSHVLVPPAIEAVINDPESRIQGFLAAGHVCTIMGLQEYGPLVEKYNVPIVATGFEPVDLLQGILMTLKQLESGESKLENQYSRVIRPEGNPEAQQTIFEVFEVADREWRGIGTIPGSGYEIKKKYSPYDAKRKFDIHIEHAVENPACIAGQVLKGIKKPPDCPEFARGCSPENPLGAPMVSSEGACAAYYHYSNTTEKA